MKALQCFFVIGLLVIPIHSNARTRGCHDLSTCIKFADIIVSGVIQSQEDSDDKTGLAHVKIDYVYKGSFREKEIIISDELFHSKFTPPGMSSPPQVKQGVQYIFFIKSKIPPKGQIHQYGLYDLESGVVHRDQPVSLEILLQLKQTDYTDDLLKSDVIIVGRVDALTPKGNSAVPRVRGDPVDGIISEADVFVIRVLNGKKVNRIKIGGLLSAANPDVVVERQTLETNKTYLIFLQQEKNQDSSFSPVFPAEFAWEIKNQLPDQDQGTLREQVREIARNNIKTADIFVATKWAEVLRDVSQSEDDISIWREIVKDRRVGIRGVALSWIAEHKSSEPGLRLEIENFLSEASKVEGTWRTRTRLDKLLPKLPR